MQSFPSAGGLVALSAMVAGATTTTTPFGPLVTDLVPVRPDAHDPSWPPVLVFCVLVVVVGGLFAAFVFLRRAWTAAHVGGGPFDG